MSLLQTIATTLKDKVSAKPSERIAGAMMAPKTEKPVDFGGIFKRLFEPEPVGNKVRVRDVYREIPEAVEKVGTKVVDFGRETLQSIARNTGSVGISAVNKINKVLNNGPEIREIKPPEQINTFEDALYSVLFGDDAIESVGERVKKAPERADDFAKNLGFGGQKVVNTKTAPFIIPALIGLDLTGGGSDDIFARIAKSKSAEEIFQFIKGNIDNVPDDVAKSLSQRLVNVKDAGEVKTVIDEGLSASEKIVRDTSLEVLNKVDGVVDSAVDDVVDTRRVKKFGDSGVVTSRERGFITTVKESPRASDEVASKIASTYNPINNADTLARAKSIIASNYDEAMALVKDTKSAPTAESNAVAQLLIQQAQQAKRWNEAIELVEITARRATNPAQALQALSMWNRLSPEGVLRYTQKIVNDVNKTLPPTKHIKITDDVAVKLVEQAKKIEKIPDGEEKAVETAVLVSRIQDLIPSSSGQKIAMFQTLAQLLNPKTLIRNLVGNFGFGSLENLKDYPAAALDSALSLVTGTRTTTMPSLTAQAKGAKEGFRQGIRDALLGIDTMGVPSQFDLPKTPVFKGSVGRMAEKFLNVVLRAPDRATYKAAYDGSLYKQMKAYYKTTGKVIDEPTEEMKEVAHHEGLYRTFQDENVISNTFVALKRALNVLSPLKDFGLGDIILKYPKTPGNLLARGIDYSPGGFVNSLFQMSRPLVGQKFNQKAFVEATSRALVGTSGLVGAGALLHRLGIITGQREKDKDIAAVQRLTGLGGYKFNVSALKRFVMSGLNPKAAETQEGDVLYSYDWFQPVAIGVSIGANIDEASQTREKTKAKVLGIADVLIEGMASGADTLGEQPLVQNLTRVTKYGSLSDFIVQSAKQIPQTFVPTLLNQINQFVDNRSRNVYDPSVIHEAMNMVKRKVPGLSQTLQPQVSVFGEEMEIYQNGSNNLFNVFFNPAFKTIYKPSPEAELVLNLFEQTGETTQAPRVVGTTVKVNGGNIKLGPKQVVAMQQFTGTLSRWYFHKLAQSPDFQKLPDEQKINHMSNSLTDIGKAAKIVVLGDRPTKNPGARVQVLIANYLRNPFLQTDSLIND